MTESTNEGLAEFLYRLSTSYHHAPVGTGSKLRQCAEALRKAGQEPETKPPYYYLQTGFAEGREAALRKVLALPRYTEAYVSGEDSLSELEPYEKGEWIKANDIRALLSEPTKPNWLNKQLDQCAQEVSQWPDYKKNEPAKAAGETDHLKRKDKINDQEPALKLAHSIVKTIGDKPRPWDTPAEDNNREMALALIAIANELVDANQTAVYYRERTIDLEHDLAALELRGKEEG